MHVELAHSLGQHLVGFFNIRENLGNAKEKPTRKTCFSRKMKFEVTEGKLSLLLKHNFMHVEKYSCEQLLYTYNPFGN